MKYRFLFSLITLAFSLVSFSLSAAPDSKEPAVLDEVKAVSKEAATLRRKAMDCRVMSLNALKNADAVRGKEHEALVQAMTSGDSDRISETREKLDRASDDLKDVIGAVNKVIEYCIKTDISAGSVEEACKVAASDEQKRDESAADKLRSRLDSAEKHLTKAESIAERLRKKWLEPLLTSKTVSSSTTSTTKAESLPPAK